MLMFDGCVLSLVERRIGTLPRELTFLQKVSQRFFGRTITSRQSAQIDHAFAASCLVFALARRVFVR